MIIKREVRQGKLWRDISMRKEHGARLEKKKRKKRQFMRKLLMEEREHYRRARRRKHMVQMRA